jgi:hypothetical protein
MYNRANVMGSNVVFVCGNIDFTTSITFYGQTCFCSYDEI